MKQFDPVSTLIFECITGSRLYGTNTPESDWDYRGVCLVPLEIQINPFQGFEQKDSGFEEEDRVIYGLSKFLRLCADSNPNIIELLFIPEDKVVHKNYLWDILMNYKSAFLSKKCRHTFSGYAFSQIKSIKAHRKWFINPPKEKPKRKDFGLSDSPLVSGDALVALSNVNRDFLNPTFADEIRRELEYRDAKTNWDNYISWYNNRSPERRALEERFGYDTKHASHVLRLMLEGKELLLHGHITFPLPEAQEILDVKRGKYSYEEILNMADEYDSMFEGFEKDSPLPYSPNRDLLAEVYVRINWPCEEHYHGG